MRASEINDSFELMYMMAATGGRGDELFGDCENLLLKAVKNFAIEGSTPSFYLEFPLIGEPCADISLVYNYLPAGSLLPCMSFFGYQKAVEWYHALPLERGYSIGFEVDASSGETDKAGIVFQQRRSPELIEPFLKNIGEERRAASYLTVSERLPSHMSSAYIAIFPGRPEAVTRMGGYMNAETSNAIAESPEFLRSSFEAAGFKAWNDEMLSLCRALYSAAGATDFQFDICPDGSLSDTFGLNISLNHVRPADALRCTKEADEKAIFAKLKQYGLIDERYKKLPGASFAKGFPGTRYDGSAGLLALSSRFSYVKVKFKGGKPVTTKFYMLMKAAVIGNGSL